MSLNSHDSSYNGDLLLDTSKITGGGERGHKLHESNDVVEQTSSPLRREVVNR